MRLHARLAPALPALLVAAGGLALVLSAFAERAATKLFEDERGYASAASHLLRDGVLSFSPLGVSAPEPDAYREPAYPALIAAAWWLSGARPPADPGEVERLAESGAPWHAARALHLILLTAAAAGAGAAALRLGGARTGALAFALVAASPALHRQGAQLMSENLAAAHLALAGLSLLALARGERGARLAAVAVVGLLPLTRAEGALLLPLTLALAAWAPAPPGAPRRRRTLAWMAVGLALPGALWCLRNTLELGHALLSDRGGLALAVRAELDREVARQGALSAALAWTPLERAHRLALELAPDSNWLDYRPTGAGNFYLRTLRRWQGERAAPGADPLAIDARFGRAALASFAGQPVTHLRAGAAVAVRGLFAEASPAWAEPFDLELVLGLALGVAMVIAAFGALRRRRLPELAFWAPAWLLFGFHVGATELLPRYALPLLPFAWTALALALAARREREPAG